MRSTHHTGVARGGTVAHITTTRSTDITTTRGDIGTGTTATVHSTIHGLCQATTHITTQTTATRTSIAIATTTAQAAREVQQHAVAAAISRVQHRIALHAVLYHRPAAQRHRPVELQQATQAQARQHARLPHAQQQTAR